MKMGLAEAFEKLQKDFKSYVEKEVLNKADSRDVRIYFTGLEMEQVVRSDRGRYDETLDFMDLDLIVDIIKSGKLVKGIVLPQPTYPDSMSK